MPTIPRSTASRRVPDGILAAVLACLIAVAAGHGAQVYARWLASRHLDAVTTAEVPFKFQTLTVQRAALASGHVLPIYGSSELFCCGHPFRPMDTFASRVVGFDTLSLGHPGTSDLYFALTFAALGHDLRDRRVVVSDSPIWFSNPEGPPPAQYGSNFSAEAAYAFVFDAPISTAVREMGARRMLAYPDTLRDQPLLRRAVEDLAHPTWVARAGFTALSPLGHIATWALQVRDATRTVAFLWKPRRRPDASSPPPPSPPDWVQMAAQGTRVAQAENTTNPFGFTDEAFRALRRRPKVRDALALYGSGRNNRDGGVLAPPDGWRRSVARSTEWADLRLALRVLREVDARPLVWTLPLPGAFYDYTPVSARARQTYYERFERMGERAGVPWLDFRAYDEDRYFVSDPSSHLSARGWVFADRAVDVFWHSGSVSDIHDALATLTRDVPPPPEPLADAGRAGAASASN